ncbi:MAG: hypothetical protein ACRDSZ_08380 [Pseudonocardiaceae bacterium]
MKRPIPPDTGSGSAAPLPVADRSPAPQAAQDDSSQPQGYYVGECGHRVPLIGPVGHIGPGGDCDPSTT